MSSILAIEDYPSSLRSASGADLAFATEFAAGGEEIADAGRLPLKDFRPVAMIPTMLLCKKVAAPRHRIRSPIASFS